MCPARSHAQSRFPRHSARTDEIQLPPLHDTGSAWYALLSFLLPVIGIIAAMIFKKHRHYRNYKMCKKGAIAGFIVLAVILALFLLALAAVFI